MFYCKKSQTVVDPTMSSGIHRVVNYQTALDKMFDRRHYNVPGKEVSVSTVVYNLMHCDSRERATYMWRQSDGPVRGDTYYTVYPVIDESGDRYIRMTYVCTHNKYKRRDRKAWTTGYCTAANVEFYIVGMLAKYCDAIRYHSIRE